MTSARRFGRMGGGGALIFAAFLLLRGEIAVAVPLGLFGFGLLGWAPGWPATFGARTHKSAGQASQVRTAFLEMQLGHDSGAMHGSVLSGRYEGVALDALDVATLMGLLGEIDSDSRDLLAAYLDRREPGWRERAQGDASAGRSEAPRDGKMTIAHHRRSLSIPSQLNESGETNRHNSRVFQRYRHLADMPASDCHGSFRGKADMLAAAANDQNAMPYRRLC